MTTRSHANQDDFTAALEGLATVMDGLSTVLEGLSTARKAAWRLEATIPTPEVEVGGPDVQVAQPEPDVAPEQQQKSQPEQQPEPQPEQQQKSQPAPKPTDANLPTLEEVRARAAGLVHAGKQEELKNIINSMGADRLSQIPQTKYPQLLEEIDKAAA